MVFVYSLNKNCAKNHLTILLDLGKQNVAKKTFPDIDGQIYWTDAARVLTWLLHLAIWPESCLMLLWITSTCLVSKHNRMSLSKIF